MKYDHFGFEIVRCCSFLNMAGQTVVGYFCLIFLGVTSGAIIPDYIHICTRSDPEVTKCVQNSVEDLRPRLKTGIPEMNVPALEPLRINNIVISRGTDSSNFKASLNNVDVFGASGFTVKRLKLDIPNHTYIIDITFDQLSLVGEFDVEGRVLVVPINGHGKFYANVSNCDAHGTLKGKLVDVNNVRYLNFVSLDLDITIEDYKIRLDNLFQGDEVLSKAANDIINQNRGEFMRVSIPYIEQKASEIILEAANNIVKNFPYDEVFPEK